MTPIRSIKILPEMELGYDFHIFLRDEINKVDNCVSFPFSSSGTNLPDKFKIELLIGDNKRIFPIMLRDYYIIHHGTTNFWNDITNRPVFKVKVDQTEDGIIATYTRIKYSTIENITTIEAEYPIQFIKEVELNINSGDKVLHDPKAKPRITAKVKILVVEKERAVHKILTFDVDMDKRKFMWHGTPYTTINSDEMFNKAVAHLKC